MSVVEPDSKEDINKQVDSKKNEKPLFGGVSPIIVIVVGLLIFFAFQSSRIKSTAGDTGNSNIWLLVGGLVILWWLSRQTQTLSTIMFPKEAYILTEREAELKARWEHWPILTKYTIGPEIELYHRDARGVFYEIAFNVQKPFLPKEYYIAKVMAKGEEKGIITFIRQTAPYTGRNTRDTHDITKVPDFLKRANRFPILEKMWGGGRL